MERGSKYSVCPGCEALLLGDEPECPNCGTSTWSYGSDAATSGASIEMDVYLPDAGSFTYEYAVHVAYTADELTGLLNSMVAQGWEAFSVYGGTTRDQPGQTAHFAVMRRRAVQ